MDKERKYSLFLIIIGIIILVLISSPFQKYSLLFSNIIKSFVLKIDREIKGTIKEHINQKEQIIALQKRVEELEPKASLSIAVSSRLNSLLSEYHLSNYSPRLHFVQVLSFATLNDPNKLWIEFDKFDLNKTYGLIYRGYAAGILKAKDNQPLAILNASLDTTYSVYIGEDKIIGVIFGNGEDMIIKYIPSYKDPKIGDEVITSGNDNIFYEGIKVGVITKVEIQDMYKIAKVTPYMQVKNPKFFYAVED